MIFRICGFSISSSRQISRDHPPPQLPHGGLPVLLPKLRQSAVLRLLQLARTPEREAQMVQQRESSTAQKEESCQVEQGGGAVQGRALNLNLTSILTKLKMSLTLILTKVNSISGLKNAFHRHCHVLSVLHLLAQTSLPTSLTTSLRLQDSLHHLHQFDLSCPCRQLHLLDNEIFDRSRGSNVLNKFLAFHSELDSGAR